MYENPADALEKISRYMNLNDLPDMRDNSLICCEERRNANQNPVTLVLIVKYAHIEK